MARTALIVDDHERFRHLARQLLELAGFDVIGEEADAASGVAAATRLQPHLVLLDVHLPDGLGFDVAQTISVLEGSPMVVLTSAGTAEDFGDLVTTSRASAFISKSDLSVSSLRAVVDPDPDPGPGDTGSDDPGGQARR